jgi:hypothetical protein
VIHILWYNFCFLLYLLYYNKNIIYKEKNIYFIIIFYYFIDIPGKTNSLDPPLARVEMLPEKKVARDMGSDERGS